MRGILATAVILHTREGEEVVFPAGAQVDITSSDEWYHDISETDIHVTMGLLEKHHDTR